jgi:hypothetical protein
MASRFAIQISSTSRQDQFETSRLTAFQRYYPSLAITMFLCFLSAAPSSFSVRHFNPETSIPTNTCTALLLAGCSSSSPLIPGIFLLSLYYQHWTPTYDPAQNNPAVFQQISSIVGSAQLEVRVGYFGICVSNGGDWLCSNNATALAQSYNIEADPLNLIWVAKTFKDNVVFPYLL